MKRILMGLMVLASVACVRTFAHAVCYEVSISTCVGDFANGGDAETGPRLLGNTSGYSLAFIQNSRARIFIASGAASGQVSSAPTAGYVGIFYDGITQFPQYTLDIAGMVRSTDSALFATTTGYVAIGTIPVAGPAYTSFYFLIGNGTFTVQRNGQISINGLAPPGDARFYVNGKSSATAYYGDGSNLTGISAGGGGSAPVNSTDSVVLYRSGGQVSYATYPFVAVQGLSGPLSPCATFWFLSLQAYTMEPSSVAVTKFQIVKSTSNSGAFPYTNWGPQIHSSTGTAFGVSISTTLPFFAGETYALHIDSVPISGKQATTYGIVGRRWKDEGSCSP